MQIPSGAVARRAIFIDVTLAPFLGFFVGTVGTSSGSVSRGLVGAGIWIAVAFVPTFLLVRRGAKDAASGSIARFTPPRWLRRQGVGWALKVSHQQRRESWQSPKLSASWSAPGFLYPTETTFEFVPDRASQSRVGRELATEPRQQSVFFVEIAEIDHAVPTGAAFGGARYPMVRIRLANGSIEWFSAHECIAREAAALLNGFLPHRDERRS